MKRNQLLIQHGSDPGAMTRRLLERGNIENLFKPGTKVGIKPNLVMAKPASSGATTHVEIVEALIGMLQQWGVSDITIMESAWVGDCTRKAYKRCGYERLARSMNVQLLDLKKDRSRTIRSEGFNLAVCCSPFEVDCLINVPVLKGHCQTLMTCALKNMKGCIPDSEKRRFHTLGLHGPIAALNTVLRQHLVLVDAINGDLAYEGGGSPIQQNRLLLARDPVLIDAWAANLLGYSVEEIEYLRLAAVMGVGSADLEQAEIHEEGTPLGPGYADRTACKKNDYIAGYIDDLQACSSCYASLVQVLKSLDKSGDLSRLRESFSIGQGFRGTRENKPGIGNCTSRFDRYIPGCPPEPEKIMEFIIKEMKRSS